MFLEALIATLICAVAVLSLYALGWIAVWTVVILSYIPHRIDCWRRGEKVVPVKETVRAVWRMMLGNSIEEE